MRTDNQPPRLAYMLQFTTRRQAQRPQSGEKSSIELRELAACKTLASKRRGSGDTTAPREASEPLGRTSIGREGAAQSGGVL